MEGYSMIQQLFAHMEWADAAIWRAVMANDAAMADKTLHDRLHHVHLVQHAFLTVWRGVTFVPRAADSFDSPRLMEWAREYHAEARQFLARFDGAALDDPMPMPWAARAAERMGRPSAAVTSIGETMIQVVSHSTHHRAQVALRLREVGGEPPLTDFIAWTWLGKPAPEWPGR